MGRTAAGTAGTTTDERREPEIITSGHLANILTLRLVEMIEEATTRYEAQSLGRVMAPELAAMRGTVDEIRAWHRLAEVDWNTGLLAAAPASDNGATPAEVTS